MKAVYLHAAGALALTFGLAACVPSIEPTAPTPAPVPVATPAPAPVPTPTPTPPPVIQEPTYGNYLDAPQSPGTWTYVTDSQGPRGVFGTDVNNPDFLLRCTGPRLALARRSANFGSPERALTITTETATRTLQTSVVPSGSRGNALFAIGLDPYDPLLDAMAITKGRIAIGVEGERTLYLPAWVEISRVIEDCR